MLKKAPSIAPADLSPEQGGRRLPPVVIVAAEYNRRFVDGLIRGARRTLAGAGWPRPRVLRVPGSYEIPVVTRHLVLPTERCAVPVDPLQIPAGAGGDARMDSGRVAKSPRGQPGNSLPGAVLCLGLIWQGKTRHADLIASAITHALMNLQVASGIPCVHEILVVDDETQARQRCLDPETNRGSEAAQTAIRMIRLLESLNPG